MAYERRHFVRVGFETPGKLVIGQRKLQVKVLDVSLKGALIQLPVGVSVTDQSTGRLAVSLSEQMEQISMTVKVTHIDGNHLGLLCTSCDIDSVTHLRRVIELQLGDAALLQRDLAELINSREQPI